MRVVNLFSCLRGPELRKDRIGSLQLGQLENASKIESSKEIEEKSKLWLQVSAALSASFALMACGSFIGWTSPALPYLTSPESEFPVTTFEGSWITSLYTLGGILGALISPLLIDRIGRKLCLLAFGLPQLIGWTIIITAKSYVYLYVARFIAGIAHGGIYNVSVIYLAEIAEKEVRGAFGSLLKTSTNLGGLFVATAGACLSYKNLNFVSLALPILFFVTFSFMPESPYFYLIKDNDEKAGKTLMKLRRFKMPSSVAKDLGSMKDAVVEGKQRAKGFAALKELIYRPGNRRALWILLSLKVTQQLSGHMAIIAYTQEIFSYSDSKLKPEHGVVLLGLAQLIAGLAAAGLVDRLGRRPLILISGIAASIALGLVGIFFFCKYKIEADVSSFSWLPLVAIIVYEIMVAVGIGTLPYVILGEIFPTNVKGSAVASGILIGSIFAFLVGLGFQALNSWAGIYATFWFFSACCASGTLWVFFITPETKGKTLEEIQVILNRG